MPVGSAYLEEVFEILDSVRGKPQIIEERKRLSIALATLMLSEASITTTSQEKEAQEQFSKLVDDPVGKAFTAAVNDQWYRSANPQRIANQMIHLLNQFGMPQYLPWLKRSQLYAFRLLSPRWAQILVSFASKTMREEASNMIIPAEIDSLSKHLELRKSQGISLNIIRLGEAILDETEAAKRLETYLQDLESLNIEHMSVKLSTLYSQINLIDFEGTVEILAERLRTIYRAAIQHPLLLAEGAKQNRFITLDMEEYDSLHLTVAVFRKVLEEPEFHNYSAGIALQAYLPDAYQMQKQLTEWAKNRIQNGGAPISIRLVKGAYLATEKVEASIKNWPQSPYLTKIETDANYKRMLGYGTIPENARAVHLSIGTHNLFDLAYAMLLRIENQVEPYVGFEMLEGMVEPIRRIVHQLTGDMLLYCPIALKKEFPQATAYLLRRLDENTCPENFLRHLSKLKIGSENWEIQISNFSESCDQINTISSQPRRTQNHLLHTETDSNLTFENEPHTDFSLPQNRCWAKEVASIWKTKMIESIPLVIAGQEITDHLDGVRFDPSAPERPLYRYALSNPQDIEHAIDCAEQHEQEWASTSIEHRCQLLSNVAQELRERRCDFIGAMMMDGGKIISEADPEVSEAIDFAEYYRHQIERKIQMKDIRWEPKGTVLVLSSWNFPCSITTGNILSAIVTGNCVLLRPTSHAVLVAWYLVNAMWDAGIPKDVLQFIPCTREIASKHLIVDPRVHLVAFTGSTATAHQFLKLRPGIDLMAEASGKNSIIITAMADRELAIRELISSAFGHNGQKCSAASLAILESEVYDDPKFMTQLRDAAASLKVGPAWDLASQISPLIAPSEALQKGITTLEEKEEWLLKPVQDTQNHHLWSPGIKRGVQEGSFTHQTEFFGPLLGLMRAESLEHAIHLANSTPYGCTAGLMSLDERDHDTWIEQIEAGNCYINRSITGSMIRRQPFGGIKASSFGSSKTGGPNRLRDFMKATQIGLPQEKLPVNEAVNSLTLFLDQIHFSAEELGIWYASVANYTYWWKRLSQNRDPSKIIGQDNYFRYAPRKNMVLRIDENSQPLDFLRICAAVLTIKAGVEVSVRPQKEKMLNWPQLAKLLHVIEESDDAFLDRVRSGQINRVRLVTLPSIDLKEAAAQSATLLIDSPVLANGRLELLHYLREISISIDYHRYGNLGLREGELRRPIG